MSGGFCLGGFCPGGFVGGICAGDFCPRTILASFFKNFHASLKNGWIVYTGKYKARSHDEETDRSEVCTKDLGVLSIMTERKNFTI